MALFQKKPQLGTSVPLYTTGLQETKIVIGLGNVGRDYDHTRHNIGFAVADAFAKTHDLPDWREQKDLKCHISMGQVGALRVIVAKPTTLMNLSGEAAQKVAHFYKVHPQNILAIYDELDIPFGQIRSRKGGSSAGHNGVKSLIEHLGEDFGRLRIGIDADQRGHKPGANYVLSKFNAHEQEDLPLIIQEAVAMVSDCLHANPFPLDTRTIVFPEPTEI